MDNKFCENPECGSRLDDEKIRRSGAKGLRFCSRQCAARWMVLSGEYSRIGKLGVKAQAAYKAEHGHVPQYEKRSAAVTLSNIEHPRRRKKGQTAMPQYYAITFHERKTRERGSGRQQVVPAWFIASGPHASRQAAENAGLELYAPRANEDGGVDNLDFTTETDRKNLRVVPTSKLKEYHIDLDMVTQ